MRARAKFNFDLKEFEGRQLTAARALAELSITELANEANVTRRTLHRLETEGRIEVSTRKKKGFVTERTVQRIFCTLHKHGVTLIAADRDGGRGVRWLRPPKSRGSR